MTTRIELPGGGSLSIEQALTLSAIQAIYTGEMHWHNNNCGCCITAHFEHGAYLIGDDGEFTFYSRADLENLKE